MAEYHNVYLGKDVEEFYEDNDNEYHFMFLSTKEFLCLVDEGYFPVILVNKKDNKDIVLITQKGCAHRFHNHCYNGSGTDNFRISDQYDLEFVGTIKRYLGNKCGPNGEIGWWE